MARKEHFRDMVSSMPDAGYWKQKADQGWELSAIEWVRGIHEEEGPQPVLREEVPYGMQVSEDCMHLIENPKEREALTMMLGELIADKPLSEVAKALNQQGFRTRRGAKWDSAAVFHLFPRLIEAAPQIYPTQDWADRRRQLFRIA